MYGSSFSSCRHGLRETEWDSDVVSCVESSSDNSVPDW